MIKIRRIIVGIFCGEIFCGVCEVLLLVTLGFIYLDNLEIFVRFVGSADSCYTRPSCQSKATWLNKNSLGF